MRPLLGLLVLLAGCGASVDPEPRSEVVAGQPLHARFVRVHLRSLGDWQQVVITGKAGLKVDDEQMKRFVLRRDEARTLTITDDAGIVLVDGRAYSGDLFWRHRLLINNVALENYVLGVLRGELGLKQVPVEAAAAQAIAVRSYTLHYVKQHQKKFDVDDTTRFQVYAGLRYAPDDDNLRQGVNDTAATYLEFGGEPLKAYYHSTCGGHTTDARTGLNRKEPWPTAGVVCDGCQATRYYRWTARIEAGRVLDAAGANEPLTSVSILETGAGERAKTVEVNGQRMSASEFRMRLGAGRLRSTRIEEIRRVGAYVVFVGGGWGHGVGLCQFGAIGYAKQGWSARRIVAHYYPGAELVRPPDSR